MRNKKREKAAQTAADFIQRKFIVPEKPIGLILGTGWGEVVNPESRYEIPFSEIPGLEKIHNLEGHKRNFSISEIKGRPVIILNGRVHMNESPNDNKVAKMVRLQTELLCKLGVKTIIATCAAGALERELPLRYTDAESNLKVGEIAVIDGFVSLYAQKTPLWGAEFFSPDSCIRPRLNKIALKEHGELVAKEVGYVMLRGPQFEGTKYDKKILAASGAGVVGMSMYPEACICAAYEVDFIGLCFVSNDDKEAHSHEENLSRAKKASSLLGSYLERIISQI